MTLTQLAVSRRQPAVSRVAGLCGALIAACALAASLTAAAVPRPLAASSPDGNIRAEFLLQPGGVAAYRIDYRSRPVVLPSRLGFEPGLDRGFQVAGSSTRRHRGRWTPVCGER